MMTFKVWHCEQAVATSSRPSPGGNALAVWARSGMAAPRTSAATAPTNVRAHPALVSAPRPLILAKAGIQNLGPRFRGDERMLHQSNAIERCQTRGMVTPCAGASL